jgi:hypothetical protein
MLSNQSQTALFHVAGHGMHAPTREQFDLEKSYNDGEALASRDYLLAG